MERKVAYYQKYVPSQETRFSSITADILELSRKDMLSCPDCKRNLDLDKGVDWKGPTDLSCRYCNSLINIENLIQKKLQSK